MYNFYDKTNRNSLAALLQCSFSKALPRPFTRLAEHSRSHRVLPRLRPPLVETTIKDSDIDLVHSSPCATLANFHLCLEDSLVPSKLAMPTLSHSTHVTTSKKTFDADVNLLMLSTRISRQSHFHSRQKYQILVQRKVDVEHKPEKKRISLVKIQPKPSFFLFLSSLSYPPSRQQQQSCPITYPSLKDAVPLLLPHIIISISIFIPISDKQTHPPNSN
jgi:hypothetical protein